MHYRSESVSVSALAPGKIVCVGRNYAEHARELGNSVPESPVLFMKPNTSLCHWQDNFSIPNGRGECHHELELALLIKSPLSQAREEDCLSAVAAVGLALDLTLRDEQTQLKQAGKPWEMAKAFDGACPISAWIPVPEELDSLTLELVVNGQLRQRGNSADMLWSPQQLLHYISQFFTLNPGDIVLTGTPSGVAALSPGDEVVGQLGDLLTVSGKVINE
ncbi:MAG: fumarylacetoacetate hydrolase family protein [Gammaproteobacteria bacterium]|nr:fumarylacetoacetate hydrolase family protein [Gammaproteobacteria bacterium]